MLPFFTKFQLKKQQPSGITSANTCINAPVRREFHLSHSEAEIFAKSGSKKLMFDFDGGGIGVRVWYADEQGKWVEITDYSTW